MSHIEFIANDLNDTERLGAALAKTLPDGTTIGLSGTLGAGKTRLVQAIAAHCGVPRSAVVSPTFVLCQEYYGDRTIYHLDAYRLQSDEEFQQLGTDELFHSDGLVIIEWAERVAKSLPANRIDIRIELIDDDKRQFNISSVGEKYDGVVERVKQELQ